MNPNTLWHGVVPFLRVAFPPENLNLWVAFSEIFMSKWVNFLEISKYMGLLLKL